MSQPSTYARATLSALAGDVEYTDRDSALAAREHAVAGSGRLAELTEWLAETQRRWPPRELARARLVVLGDAELGQVAAVAESSSVGLQVVPVPADPAAAFHAGVAAADAEVEAGADLLVLAAADVLDARAAAGVLVGLLTGTEPVALLPRGAEAIDTFEWIARAEHLRDARRKVAAFRGRPDELLVALGSPTLSAAAGFVLRAIAGRAPVVLDGTTAVCAALLCHDVQPRCKGWWRVADTSADPIHTRALDELGERPLLDLGTRRGDGTAGVLCVQLLRAATPLTLETPR